MNQSEVEEKLLGNVKFTFAIEDHGVEWKRNAGHEWHQPEGSGHTLWVGDPAPDGGFGWMVIDDATQMIVDKGFAATRPLSRKAAVFALARHLGIFDEAKQKPMGWPMKLAAVVILGCCAGAALLSLWLVLR